MVPLIINPIYTLYSGYLLGELNGTESQRTPFSKLRERAIGYSGFFGVRSVGPTVGDFLDYMHPTKN